MKKIWRSGHHIRYFACAMAIIIGLLPPCSVLAAEEKTSEEDSGSKRESSVVYITAFEPLAEEDAFLSCMEKPRLEELTDLFPETLLVQIEGKEESEKLEVVWESEESFEETKQERYTFYPKWDKTRYMVADSAENTIEIPTITVEVPVDKGMIPELEKAKDALHDIIENKSILALVYLCDKYEVKSAPSSDADTVHTVVSGQSVQITDAELDEYGNVWYQTLFYQNGKEYTGYIERGYLAASDEDFIQWEEEYLVIPQAPAPRMMKARRAVVSYPDVEQFPASYQNALYELKANHPNWVFVRMDTGIDWNTAISREMGDKSLVPSSSSGSWQNGVYGQGWSYASEGILKYYMDPRNFLTDPAVFQFEQLTYNASYHTSAAVQEILKNSFMSSGIPGDNRTYAQAFTAIGESTGVSPFHLASRVLQEQGTKGTSALISGSYPGYEGYYNYFNVSASGKTNAEVVQNGLKKAKEQGWNTRYISLNGGACVIGANYILKGQDTLYLEKFNVSNGYHANFTHQYMQNIQAPNSEASNIRKAYNNAGALENSFVFKIPVFQNMPASACTKPNTTDTITLDKTTVDGLQVNSTIKLNPYVNGSKVDYISNMTFSSDNTSVATVDSTGKVTAVSPGTAVISCTRIGAGTAVCTVAVVKADPDISTPILSPCIYQEGLRLADISLPIGWTWVNGNIKIEAGTHSYDAIYTPEDTVKYNTVTKKISFAVSKAIPICKMPEKPKAFVGSTLGEITLPEGFVWESDTKTRLQEPGEYTFYVSYNPDEKNYSTVGHVPFIVQVVGETSKPDEGDGTSSGGSTSAGSGTNSGDSTNTGSGTSSGGSTSAGSGTNSGDSTNTGSGTSSGGSTSTGSGTSSSDGTSTGSGTSSGGSTSMGSGTNSGDSTNTGSGTSSGGSTSTGSGTSSSDSTSTGSGTSSGGSTSTGGGTTTGESTGSGSGTISSGSSTNTGDSTTSEAGSSNVGAPLKELPNQTTSTTNKKDDSSAGNKPTQESSGSSQPTQNGTDSSQSTQNAADSSQSTQNAANSGQSTQNAADSSQSTQNTADTRQSTQNAADSSQSTKKATGTKQSSRAERGSANDETEKESKEISSQTKTAEESQTQTQEPEESLSKPVVMMAMEDTTILTPETLQMAKGQNLDLLLDMGKYVTWRIDIDSVDMNTVAEVDMGINLGTENIPTEIIAAILDGNKYVEFTLAHDGAFGFNPVLQIALDPMYQGWYANLFYYNEEAASLEFICDTIIGSDGTAAFDLEHASSYVIIVSPASMAGVSASVDTESHVTSWIIVGMIVCMIVIGVGCGIFFYRKKTQEEDEADAYEEDEEEEYEEAAEEEEYEEAEEEEYEEAAEEEEYEEAKEEDEEVKEEWNETGEEEYEHNDEDDWIEDEDWQEPETPVIASSDRFADDHAEDDWIDDDEWDIGNDWIEDAEWERKKEA